MWTHPVIYSLPSKHYAIVNAPVPLIAGINMTKVNFYKRVVPEFLQQTNYLFVFMDEEKEDDTLVYSHNIATEFILPSFNDKLAELREEYRDFELLAKYGQSKKFDLSWDKHMGLGLNFAIIFRKMLEECLVDKLPPKPLYEPDTVSVA